MPRHRLWSAVRAGWACWILLVLLSQVDALAQVNVSGVTDKSTYTGSVTFTIAAQSGYSLGATLNGTPVPIAAPVTVSRMDYYDLRAWRTNQAAPFDVASNLVRFIVVASDRGSPEKGLIKWTPYPRIPSTASEWAGAELKLLLPSHFPAGLPIPVVARVADAADRERRGNGEITAAGFEDHPIAILRGHGSGFLPAAEKPGVIAYNARLASLSAPRQVTIESNTAWLPVSGTLTPLTAWPENSRIHITGPLTIPANAVLTVGAGTVVKLEPLVNITNSGRLLIQGTPELPVVFTATNVVATERYPSIGWGSLLLRGSQAALEAQYAIFAGGGGAQTFDFTPAASHKSAQATLLAHNGAKVDLSHCAIIFNAGQVANAYASTLTYDHCLFQRAITSGEYSGGCQVVIDHSAIIEFPADDGVVDASIADGDYDAIYFTEGTYTLKNSLIGFSKDDAIDSGSGAAGTVVVTNCWIESALHEALAWSCDGVGRVTRTIDTVTMNSGQGIECGWGRGQNSPACYADGLLSLGNAVGARIGDNYNWQYLGFLSVSNSVILHNYRDIFLKTWNSTGTGWDTNSWVDRLGQADFHGNRLTAADPRFPDNQVWEPVSDAPRLARWMSTPPDAAVGLGIALRTNRLTRANAPDGVPVRLSTFTTNRVDVECVVEGTNGLVDITPLRFEPGETVKVVPLPAMTSPVLRFALRHPVHGEITGLSEAWLFDPGQGGGSSPVTLVGAGSRWNYLDTGADAGTAWRAPEFDDSGWSNGLAQLGFSNGEEKDEATIIRRVGTNGQNTITFYFRQPFVVPPGAPAFTNLSLWMLRDDGGVAYLNGTEVFRSDSMAPAPTTITFQTPATNYNNGAAPPDNAIDRATLPPGQLLPGTNLVAVEIHQQAAGSSDVSFDFSLTGNPMPSSLRIVSAPVNQSVPVGGAAVFEVKAAGPEPMGFEWQHDGTPLLGFSIGPRLVLTNVTAADAGTYSVRAIHLDGSSETSQAQLVVVNTDADGDGMPDDWEAAHGLDPARNDAAEDPDGDGMRNDAEFAAGTDPGSFASALRLEAKLHTEGGVTSLRLSFDAIAGRDYSLQVSDRAAGAGWVELARIPTAATNRGVITEDPVATPLANRFYRVRTPATP